MPREENITFGEMRESGATKILVHCVCGCAIQMDAGRWPDDMRLSDIEPRFSCQFAATKALISDQATRPQEWAPEYASPRPLPIQRRPQA
jgi:hypothetical protein